MDEDPLQRRIYFLTFVESLEIIFSQYKETCEVILDYPKIVGEDINFFSKKSIRNIFHANIDVHSRRLIAEFPADGIKCIVQTWPFLTKADMTGFFSNSHIKDGNLQWITVKYSKTHRIYQFM